MSKILCIIKKELTQFRRDRRMFMVTFIAPVVQLVLLGYAANFDVKHLPAVVCDLDRTAASRELVAQFAHTEYFDFVGRLDDARRVDQYINHGQAILALVIPAGFGELVRGGKTARLQLMVDGSDANAAATGLNYASLITLRYAQNILVEKLATRPGMAPVQIRAVPRVWYNPELKSRNFMVPGILALLLLVMTMMLTSLAIVKEKEMGTLEQLMVTPIRPYQLVLGKLAPFVMIGIIDIVLVILVATFWFGLPVKGSVFLLGGLCVVFLLSTLGLGIFISTVSRNQQQAMLISVFFAIFPMIILSGFVFPIENMPRVIQYGTYILPLRYFFVIVRGIFQKGVGLEVLWDQALVLLLFGVAIFVLSALRFKKKIG
jgi:ABC-2 type transport system permease protein